MLSDNGLIHMINPHGRVIDVRAAELETLTSQGWRFISNPKERYYPQYDSENNKTAKDDSSDTPPGSVAEERFKWEDV